MDLSMPASISRETPMEILERRFAEGEISIEEYRARREALVDRAAESSGDEDERRLLGPRTGGG
jgi:putative oligomerization/nucleic acid binding protein